jgi:predicted RNA-binding Zn-ribbon protein involved in translation (DUF1610 family)
MNTPESTTEAYFISHCDNEKCNLGAFQYTCPHCNETVSDYKMWWKERDIWDGKPETFDCEKCGKSLTVEWVKDEYEYWVH